MAKFGNESKCTQTSRRLKERKGGAREHNWEGVCNQQLLDVEVLACRA